ncbi:MAG: arsenate reductase family protein [Betaproteobacteria bacterium]|nr:arsenate reductase family protein [Betaproteobacteria bacterium]
MSEKITIYQKPTCSKCRATLAILDDSGKEFESVNYYETPLTVEKLLELVQKLNVSLRDVLRKDEPLARELGVMTMSDEVLVKVMIDNPDLIQRPIVVRGDKAALCRPPENVKALL